LACPAKEPVGASNAQTGHGFSHHDRRFIVRIRWRLAGLELAIGSNLLL
jgi:hypothetical protein